MYSLVLFVAFLGVLTECRGTDMYPKVATRFGTIMGVSTPITHMYLGIPFAEAPTGERRLLPPADWTRAYAGGTLNATSFGDTCMMKWEDDSPSVGGRQERTVQLQGSLHQVYMSEDCLYLNVFSPNYLQQQTEKLPVLAFIYGGGFDSGSSTVFDGTALASKHNSIVVTLNYRVGALGFLPLKETKESEGTTGINGLLDQQSALRWIQKNIGDFGGDANKVMLFGESAGAMSICQHLVMPSSSGLFASAVMESGGCGAYPLEKGYAASQVFLDTLGCSSSGSYLDCLRASSGTDIILAQAKLPPNQPNFWPIIDEVNIIERPFDSLRKGKYNKVPLVAGTNTNEGSMFVLPVLGGRPLDADTYKAMIAGEAQKLCFNDSALAALLTMYPPVEGKDNSQLLVDFFSDLTFVCPTREVVREVTATGGEAYLYHFNELYGPSPPGYGVYHGAELPFVFETFNPAFPPNEDQKTLSAVMSGMWANMAASSRPTESPDFAWPTYNRNMDDDLVFRADGLRFETGRRQKQCDFWAHMPVC